MLRSAALRAALSPVRLACIRHAASVRPEPGSNSQYMVSQPVNSEQLTVNSQLRAAIPAKTSLIAILALKRIFVTHRQLAGLSPTAICQLILVRFRLHCLIYKVHLRFVCGLIFYHGVIVFVKTFFRFRLRRSINLPLCLSLVKLFFRLFWTFSPLFIRAAVCAKKRLVASEFC